jgi:hypothetical protein
MYVSEVGTNGCESTRTAITITVNSSPALDLSSYAPPAICPGVATATPVTISASSLTNYNNFVWSPSTGVSGDSTNGYTFNPTATTTYVLTATNSVTGYFNTANVVITMKPSPDITSITSSNEPLCLGSSTTLTAISMSGTTGTASVGAGATTGTSFDAIFFHSRGGNKTQQLVTAAELTAAGLLPGNITNLGLVIAAGGGTYAELAIQLAPTTTTNMSAGINNTAAFVSVYSNTNYTTTTGTNTFNIPIISSGASLGTNTIPALSIVIRFRKSWERAAWVVFTKQSMKPDKLLL